MDVDIWSDVACPWCAAGKRSLDEAMAAFEHAGDVVLRWHAFELDARGRGTFDAHRLLKHAAVEGRETALMERLMRAHAEGEPLGDRERLVRLAGEVGLRAGPARVTLAGGRYAAQVREDERLASKLGITVVPYFVLARRYGVKGAQPAEAMLEALRHAYAA